MGEEVPLDELKPDKKNMTANPRVCRFTQTDFSLFSSIFQLVDFREIDEPSCLYHNCDPMKACEKDKSAEIQCQNQQIKMTSWNITKYTQTQI